MANVSKVIEIIFAGTDNLSSITDSIGSNMSNVGNSLQDISEPFVNAAGAVAALDAVVLGLSAAAISAASEFETQTTKMKNALGATTEEAERFGDIAGEVYNMGYGDSLADSFAAVTLAQQKFGDDASESLDLIATKAFELQETFGVDYSESIATAKTLTDNFGISSSDAFDIIAKGLRDGLNSSGDFLETINEYSTQFANGGADAGQFFSLISSGFQEGMLGTDKAADTFKEFRVRILDGSDTVSEALKQLGLGPEFTNSLASGEITAIQAFETIIGKLNETEDQSIVMQAGVGLLGTQFEDLGTKAALSLTTTKTQMSEIVGTMDDMDFDTFSKSLTSAWRTIVSNISSMDLWSGVMDKGKEAVDGIAESFTRAFYDYDFGELEGVASEIWDTIAGYFKDANLDLTTVEGMSHAIDIVVESIKSLGTTSMGIIEVFAPLASGALSVIDAFNSLDDDTKELVGNVVGIGTALGTVGTVLATGGSVISGIASLTGLVSSGGALATGIAALVALLSGPVGLAVGLAAAGTAVVGFSMDNMTDETTAAKLAIEAETKTIKDLTDQIDAIPTTVPTVDIWVALEADDYKKTQELIDKASAEAYEIQVKAEVEQQEFTDFYNELVKTGNLTSVELGVIMEAGSYAEAKSALEGLAKDRSAGLIFEVEGGDSITAIAKEINSLAETYDFDITADVEYGQLIDFQSALSQASEDTGIDITTTVNADEFNTLRQNLIDSNDLTEFELTIVKNAQSFADLSSEISNLMVARVVEISAELEAESFSHEVSNITQMNEVQITASVEYAQLTNFKKDLASAIENSEIDINASASIEINTLVNDAEFIQLKQDIAASEGLTELEIKMVQDATSISDLEEVLDNLSNKSEITASVEYPQLTEFKGVLEGIKANAEIDVKTAVDISELNQFKQNLIDSSDLTELEIKMVQDAASVSELEATIDTLLEERKVVIKAEPDFEGATETIEVWTEEHGTISIEVPVDTSEIADVKKEIDKVPTEKQIEIQIQGEIDKQLETIKTSAETIQTAMEWEAKLDIAEVESSTKKIEAAYESINTTIQSTGDLMMSALDVLAGGNLDFQTKWAALEILEQEAEYREESLKMQKELNDAQVAYLKARSDALEDGNIELKLSADGVEPALELIFWEVLRKIQGRVNEESADFLLGLI